MKLKKLKFSLLTVLLDYLSGSPHPKSISVSMIPQAQVHLLLYPGSPFLSFVFHMSMRGLHELFFLLPPLLHSTMMNTFSWKTKDMEVKQVFLQEEKKKTKVKKKAFLYIFDNYLQRMSKSRFIVVSM